MRSIILRFTMILLIMTCWAVAANAHLATLQDAQVSEEFSGKTGSLAEAEHHDKALDDEAPTERQDSEAAHWGNVKALWR